MLPIGFFYCKATKLFTNMNHKLHNYPKSIVLDSNPIFLSKFWKSLLHLMALSFAGAPLTISSQTDKWKFSNAASNPILMCLRARKIIWGKFFYLHTKWSTRNLHQQSQCMYWFLYCWNCWINLTTREDSSTKVFPSHSNDQEAPRTFWQKVDQARVDERVWSTIRITKELVNNSCN